MVKCSCIQLFLHQVQLMSFLSKLPGPQKHQVITTILTKSRRMFKYMVRPNQLKSLYLISQINNQKHCWFREVNTIQASRPLQIFSLNFTGSESLRQLRSSFLSFLLLHPILGPWWPWGSQQGIAFKTRLNWHIYIYIWHIWHIYIIW